MARKVTIWILGSLLASYLSVALPEETVIEFTETSGPYALGYPVPVPVDSLTPVDGFRSYQSLHARYQDLMLSSDRVRGSVVGTSVAGRQIWAYVISDEDPLTTTGLVEPTMLVSAMVHPREWVSSEVAAAIFEHLVENSEDHGLLQFLIENNNILIVPIVNPDGFEQTQRYPTQAVIGGDSRGGDVPRDGRMRRKNMTGVDEDLFTFEDHLLGTDINRQWPPFWANSASSSDDPTSIVYPGLGPLMEPESQSLAIAGLLGHTSDLSLNGFRYSLEQLERYLPQSDQFQNSTNRLRLYMDIHSFSKRFIVPKTLNDRRNNITQSLLGKLQSHLSTLGQDYSLVILEREAGVGATDEFFAETFQIPSWTVEVEPGPNGGVDYGGFGVPRDGFILPDSEIARVRTQLTQTSILAFYHQAGPPSVEAVKLYSSNDGQLVYAAGWKLQPDQSRVLQIKVNEALYRGRSYTLWVAFTKPMRWRQEGIVADFPGQGVSLAPEIRLDGKGEGKDTDVFIDGTKAQWLSESGGGPDGYLRYRDDAFAVKFVVPTKLRMKQKRIQLRFLLTVADLANLQLDANPATPVDWRDGAWSGYEDSDGIESDAGGTDATITLTLMK